MKRYKGGPRTSAGQARAALNALKHGLSANPLSGNVSFAVIDALHVEALAAQDRSLDVAEKALEQLQGSGSPSDAEACAKSLKALIAVERYVGRSFTKRQTAIRRGFAEEES